MNALSMRRYLSVWLSRLSIDRIERHFLAPADGPRVVATSVKSAQRVVALNAAAARLGLKLGMPLTDARAMYPSLPVAEADCEADRRLLESVADWCDRYTPLVGLDLPDGLMLDVTGCSHLFGGEAALARDLIARLKRQGFAACAAIADTVGCASGVARYGDFSSRVRVVPRGEVGVAVSPLPIAALRIDPAIVSELATMGLQCVADLIARPRAPLAARFGEALVRRLDQVLGREDEPITPRLPLPSALAEQRFAEPIALESGVLGTIEHLAQKLGRMLEPRGEGARLIQVALFRTDGTVHRLEIGTGAPLRDAGRVRRLFEDRFATLGDACDPGFGYDVIRLSALVTERCDPVQTGFVAQSHAEDSHSEELAHLIDRLGARFGLRRICRLMPQDTHIPEFAAAAMPAHAVRCPGRGDAPSRASLSRCIASGTRDENSDFQDSLSPVRPLRLFERPEPVEAIAEVPDGPPVRFRWRHVLHEVAHAEGPERIAMEWWRDGSGRALTRDYFRIESRVGARVWLYREGLYGREAERPRWYLHGLFA